MKYIGNVGRLNPVASQSKMSRRPRPSQIPEPDRGTLKKFGSHGRILFNSGDGPVRDSGNGSGWKRDSFLLVRVFSTVWG